MEDKPSDKAQPKGVFEFTYASSRYRFVTPDIRQRPFDIIRQNGCFYEQKLLEDMRQRMNRGELVIDVGANIGNHTIFLAGVCNCYVIALEPFPKSFEALTKNIEINDLGNRVTPINMAAGPKSGYGDVCLHTTADHGQVMIKEATSIGGVRIITLDDLELPRQPRMLKIDVEGSEGEVLKGAESLIMRARPLIYVETLNEQAFEGVSTFLNRMEYRVLKFFSPAMFLFASAEESAFGSPSYDPGSQLGRMCLRYRAERDKAKSTLSKSKNTPWKGITKGIKQTLRKINALVGRRPR